MSEAAAPSPQAVPAPPEIEQAYPDPRWREQLAGVRKMREGGKAAVDDFGCGPLGRRQAMSDQHMRFQTLLAAMLSSQTRDEVNEGAMARLREASGNTIEGLKSLGEEAIARAIYPVSFHHNKARNILLVCNILQSDYQGDIPRTFEDLLTLPGVGPKMVSEAGQAMLTLHEASNDPFIQHTLATLVMSYAWGETVGICVDTHVHRISNRLGWCNTWNYKGKSQNPEKTRKALERWLPREHWFEVNPLLVGLGQEVCKAISPRCDQCAISHLCPNYPQRKI